MDERKWARLSRDVGCELRRGAWYRVLRVAAVDATLDVNRTEVQVPRRNLQIVEARPSMWSVVPTPGDAVRVPSFWGAQYAVCPACRSRAPIDGQPDAMRCSQCNGLFDIAWSDAYLTKH